MYALVAIERGLDYGKGGARLGLYGPQSFRRDVFRKERGDLLVQGAAESAEGRGGAIDEGMMGRVGRGSLGHC